MLRRPLLVPLDEEDELLLLLCPHQPPAPLRSYDLGQTRPFQNVSKFLQKKKKKVSLHN